MKREQKKQEREGGGEGERESRRCVRLKAITLNKHCLGVLSLSLSLPSMSDARKMMTGRHLHVAVVSEKAKVKEEVMTGSMSFSFSISLPPSPVFSSRFWMKLIIQTTQYRQLLGASIFDIIFCFNPLSLPFSPFCFRMKNYNFGEKILTTTK